MHRGDREAVPGDADEAHEALVTRLDGSAQRALVAECELPLVGMHEAVQLDEVDLVDPHALERATDLLARRCVGALSGLGGEEEGLAMLAQPGRKAQLGVAVARRRVDVVDAVLQ